MAFLEDLQASLGTGYRLERELGGGGMSRVFLAEETALGRPVVVKVLRPELAASLSGERFGREVRLAARLQQANIVPVISAGTAGDLPYYTMPFVAGQSLRTRLATGASLPLTEVTSILRDVARALGFAHQNQVVHRDIKPENVLMSGGTAMVTDFGIAKAIAASRTQGADVASDATLTEAGMALGTPTYMAPEQVAADPATDHRADIYAFGCLAYELLTGHPPFAGRPSHEVLAAHITERPAPAAAERPEVPPALDALVQRCLEKAPGHRPQSAGEILQALDGLATPLPGPGRRPRWRRLLPAVAVIGGLGILGVAYTRWSRAETPEHHTIAVIPLAGAAADTAQEYFSDGIVDELTTSLAQAPALAVINRGSAYQFKGASVDAKAVRDRLGVDHIVMLRVRRAGPTMRVHLDLVNSATSVAVWSHEYEETIEHVRALEHDMTAAILGALGAGSDRQLVRRREPKPEAFEAYLTGRYVANRATERAGFDQALAHFQRATEIDTAFAEPYAAGAWTYQVGAGYAYQVEEGYRKADSLARRALDLDSTNAEAHATYGWATAVRRWDWTTARREIERGIALSPSNASAHFNYSALLAAQGDLKRAVEELRVSRRLDPSVAVTSFMMEYVWVALGQPDSALVTHGRLEAMSPGTLIVWGEAWITDAYRQLGRLDSALVLDQAATRQVGHPTAGLVLSLAGLGRTAEAKAAYHEMVRISKERPIPAEMLARAALAAGDREAALGWLAWAFDHHSDFVLLARFYPDLAPLKSEPRFQQLLARAGLPLDAPSH